MKLGFLGFGEVASTLSKNLLGKIEIYTCVEGRSKKTIQLAETIGLNLCKTNIEVAEISDILISAVIPSQAIYIAQEVGNYVKGVYVDINNISPSTKKKALSFIKNKKIVDASIIGSIRKSGIKVHIIASGNYAHYFSNLKKFGLNISVIGNEIGQASSIKILRSSFTKGISALIFETLYSAYKMGIDDLVLEYIAETECKDFKDVAVSRIISSGFHANRKAEEMDEVIELIEDYIEPIMSMNTALFFKSLYKKVNNLDYRPKDYKEVFEMM
jgi:3-hydroxyisobutyrate dehydrogenase-like beta-hydroxyacid dehydrogenase